MSGVSFESLVNESSPRHPEKPVQEYLNYVEDRAPIILNKNEWSCCIMPISLHIPVELIQTVAGAVSKRLGRVVNVASTLTFSKSVTPTVKGNEHERYEYIKIKNSSQGIESCDICTRVANSNANRQILCEDIIRAVADWFRRPQTTVLILTEDDIFQDDDDLYLCALSCFANKVGVASLCRIHSKAEFSKNGFWFDIKKNDIEVNDVLVQRLTKVLVHEFLHLIGFNHCNFFNCLMNAGPDIDAKPISLCPVDAALLTRGNNEPLSAYYERQ